MFSTSFPLLDVYGSPEFRFFFRTVALHWSSFLNRFLLDLEASLPEEEVGELTGVTVELPQAPLGAVSSDMATAS